MPFALILPGGSIILVRFLFDRMFDGKKKKKKYTTVLILYFVGVLINTVVVGMQKERRTSIGLW